MTSLPPCLRLVLAKLISLSKIFYRSVHSTFPLSNFYQFYILYFAIFYTIDLLKFLYSSGISAFLCRRLSFCSFRRIAFLFFSSKALGSIYCVSKPYYFVIYSGYSSECYYLSPYSFVSVSYYLLFSCTYYYYFYYLLYSYFLALPIDLLIALKP